MNQETIFNALEYYVDPLYLSSKFEENGVSDAFLNNIKNLGLFPALNFCVKYLHKDEIIMDHFKLCLKILSEYTRSKLGFCLSLADKISTKTQMHGIIDFAIQFKKALGVNAVCVDLENIDITNTKTMTFIYGYMPCKNKDVVKWLIEDLRNLVLYDLSSITYALDVLDNGKARIYIQNKKNVDSNSMCVLDFCKDVLHRKGFVLCPIETVSSKKRMCYKVDGPNITVFGVHGHGEWFPLGKHNITKENFEQELDKFLLD